MSWQRGHRQSRQAAHKSPAVALAAAAGTLFAQLSAEARSRLAQVNRACREAAARRAAGESICHAALPFICHTHEGGKGGCGKENQDVLFTAHPSEEVSVYAVLDGHGSQHGRLAAHAAAESLRRTLTNLYRWLLESPEECLRYAFRQAHEEIRRQMLATDASDMRHQAGRDGGFLLSWAPDDCTWDASTGGTTVSVAVLMRGMLVVATVGDSSTLAIGVDHAGKRSYELLAPEHSPTNLQEYERLRQTPSGAQLRFVYDCPGFVEFDIFSADADGKAFLDPRSLQQADAHEVSVKNSRNDRFTLLIIPREEFALVDETPPGDAVAHEGWRAERAVAEEQAITMTRSLGDFYAHHHGVSAEPDVRMLPLAGIGASWRQPLLMLASDGVWDLWDFEEVSEALVPLPETLWTHDQPLLQSRAADFFEKTRSRGAEFFGENADNLTAVIVDLRPALCPG